MSEKLAPSPRQSLSKKVITELRERITSGALNPGDKLPTEHKLIDEFGVSRTVIREAIAGLKVDGLVDSRQGAGVFVLKPTKKAETLSLLHDNPKTIASVIEALELRSAVEIGAAELAAKRCSPAQEAEIFDRYNAFRSKVVAAEVSEEEDFAFHVAIAQATNNKRFVEFLTLIGRNTIPRSKLRVEANLPRDAAVEERILSEHKAIMEAIIDRDAESAREAMRHHLSEGESRYRTLARQAQEMN